MRADCDAARQKIRNSAWINSLERVNTINVRASREFCEESGVDKKHMWEDDPVHPSMEGYHAIAVEIVKAVCAQWNETKIK
jgi:hypothetical protein